MEVSLARPLGKYTEARNALFGPEAQLVASLDAGREAIALFGAVHPRLFHGDTMVNLCRAYLLRGDRSEARLKCQMVVDQSLDKEARGEALYLLTRLSLWQNEKNESRALITRAAELVRGPKLKREVELYRAILNGEEWTASRLRQFSTLVGCEKGRALGESWRWLPMELGFRDEAELLEQGKAMNLSELPGLVKKASQRCSRGQRL